MIAESFGEVSRDLEEGHLVLSSREMEERLETGMQIIRDKMIKGFAAGSDLRDVLRDIAKLYMLSWSAIRRFAKEAEKIRVHPEQEFAATLLVADPIVSEIEGGKVEVETP